MADALTIQGMIDANVDVNTIEQAATEDMIVTARNGREFPSAPMASRIILEQGTIDATLKATKAELDDDTVLVDGDFALVYKDGDIELNGYYQKQAGVWEYLPYNVQRQALNQIEQAKQAAIAAAATEAQNKADAAKNDALSQVNSKIEIDETNNSDIIDERDANGTSVRKVTKDGKHLFIGLENDLETELNRSATQDVNSDNIFEQRDINGAITLKQDKDGDLHTLKVGNLTQTILDLQSKEGAADSVGINLEAAHLAGKYADYTLAENMTSFSYTDYLLKPEEVNAAEIFPYQLINIRIPALNRIGKYKYLLIFEGRETEDDFGRNSLGIVTLDIDPVTFAVSKSNMQALHTAFTDTDGKLRTFMNGCAVKLSSGKIICLYTRRHGHTEHELYMKTSIDDGATWSDYTDITSVKGDTGWNLLAACSKGIVKRFGQHVGRIVFPLWTSGVAYNRSDFRAGYIYSDDDGETWHLGEFTDYAYGNEVQCAEDLNGDMLFNVRLEYLDPPSVLVRLDDVTKEYVELKTNKKLTEDSVMSGLVQGDNIYDFSAAKIQMSTCRLDSRNELLIHTSYDGGSVWRTHLLPSTIGKGVAYSCIENISASHKFVLWEADGTKNFKYAVISLNNLIEVQ